MLMLARAAGAAARRAGARTLATETVEQRLAGMWNLRADFGVESTQTRVYLDDIVSDRFRLLRGVQHVRDELLLASRRSVRGGALQSCTTDFSLPTVTTTLAHTNCGDRCHQGGTADKYARMVASRFANVSELGLQKVEEFLPAGGGTENGATLAHITRAHHMDDGLRDLLYKGNPHSFPLLCFDIMTHCGRFVDDDGQLVFGKTKESPWREARNACGAIVGCLESDVSNAVYDRLRADLGTEGYAYLRDQPLLTTGCDVIDVRSLVAAAVIAVRGMKQTMDGLCREVDEREVAHLTACVTINRVAEPDSMIFCARGTVHRDKSGEPQCRIQGLGADAKLYSAKIVDSPTQGRLVVLNYNNVRVPSQHPIRHYTPSRETLQLHEL